MISPSIGRVVWFQPFHPEKEPEQAQPFAALVCYVHSDRMVNIGGFDSNGQHIAFTSVQLLQDDDVPPPTGRYASWMPYQKGQAAKHEATAS